MTKKMIVALAVADWMAEMDEVEYEAVQEERDPEYLARLKAMEEEDERIRKENEAWLADPANYNDINYSDIFKDTYGVRPRWRFE